MAPNLRPLDVMALLDLQNSRRPPFQHEQPATCRCRIWRRVVSLLFAVDLGSIHVAQNMSESSDTNDQLRVAAH